MLIVVLSVFGAMLIVLLLVFTFQSKGGKKAKAAKKVAKQQAMYSNAYVPTASMFQYHPPAMAGYGGSMNGV